MNLMDKFKTLVKEELESVWNVPNKDGDRYNYQHGYCHYFAYDIIGRLKKLYPNRNIRYFLLLATEYEEGDTFPSVTYLIHAYIAIDDLLFDSNGFTTEQEAEQRMIDWEKRQNVLNRDEPEIYVETDMQEFSEIPIEYFTNGGCDTKKVKRDVTKFLSHPEVRELLKILN